MLAVSNLSVCHQDKQIIKNLSFTLVQGKTLAIMGKSGSGKTTILRAIAGLCSHHRGTIQLAGQCLSKNGNNQVPPERRKISMVFQDCALFPHFTVEKNILFSLYKQSKAYQQQRLNDLLHLIALPNIAKRYPHQLSGGERQRVSLARALASKPNLLLLDEPFSSLDKSYSEPLLYQMSDIIKQAKLTTVLVTHAQKEAETLANKIVYLEQGQFIHPEKEEMAA